MFVNCGGEKTTTNPEDNLLHQFSFGHEGEVLLSSAMFSAMDRQNSIFISEHHHHKVLEFNLDGKFVREIGRMGSGPGEFIYPGELDVEGDQLYLQDFGNLRLTVFDLEQNQSTMIVQENSLLGFQVHQGYFYGFNMLNGLQGVSELGEELIHVYNSDWERIREFGTFISLEEDMVARFSEPMFKIQNDLIHVVFNYFPIYRVYNTSGELLNEMDLTELLELDEPDGNYNENVYKDAFSTGAGLLFRAIDVYENRVFIARHSPNIRIDEYHLDETDYNLTYKKTWTFNGVGERYFVYNFFYQGRYCCSI